MTASSGGERRAALVVGVGSDWGADRWGWEVADRLAPRAGEAFRVRRARSPLDLLDWLDGLPDGMLVVCDACLGAGPPGSLHRWDWPLPPGAAGPGRGSHDFGVAATLSLAERLGQLPPRVVVWGVEAGGGLEWSPQLAATAAEAARRIEAEWAAASRRGATSASARRDTAPGSCSGP